jgi:hypothetical protein
LLRKIFGLKRGKVRAEWRKLHNEELKEEDWLSVQEYRAKENISP